MTWRGSPGERVAQARFGTADRAASFYDTQMYDHVNEPMREFIARMEMLFIATADASGECDCSFRAGPPGFVQVPDEKTVIYPEYRGNGVLASIGNMLENAHIGLMFLDFFQTTVGLHVNGTARVLDASEAKASTFPPPSADVGAASRRPEAFIAVTVHEAYIHCSKHVPLLQRVDRETIAWAQRDERRGGNVFKPKR